MRNGLFVRFVGLSTCCVVLSGIAAAETYNLQVRDGTVEIYVEDWRPVSAALQLIADRHPYTITYEDARLSHPVDIADVTAIARPNQPANLGSSTASRVLAPAQYSLSTLTTLRTGISDEEAWLDVVTDVLVAQDRMGNAGKYELRVSGRDEIHVVPISARGSRGDFLPQNALLDTLITIPRQELTGMQMLDTFSEALSLAAGGTYSREAQALQERFVKLRGRVSGAVISHRGVLEANNEPARAVILRMLRQVDDDVAWQVFVTFDPNYDSYWVNFRSRAAGEGIQQSKPPNEQPNADDAAESVPSGGGFVTPEGVERLRQSTGPSN